MKHHSTSISLSLIASALFATALMTGCGSGTDATLSIQGTRPSASGAMRLASWLRMDESPFAEVAAIDSSSATIPVISKDGVAMGTILLTDARVALKEIKFEKDGEEQHSGTEIHFRGPYVVNLLTNTVAPSLESISLPEGKYDEVELKLHKIQGGEKNSDSQVIPTTDPLFGNSIYMAGTYTPQGGSAVPFKMSFDFDEKFELTGEGAVSNGMEVLKGSATPVIIAFRMAKWFDFSNTKTNSDHLDFSNITIGSELSLVSGANGSTAKIRSAVKENIKASADYGKDSDDDGVLSSGEDDDSDSDDSLDD